MGNEGNRANGQVFLIQPEDLCNLASPSVRYTRTTLCYLVFSFVVLASPTFLDMQSLLFPHATSRNSGIAWVFQEGKKKICQERLFGRTAWLSSGLFKAITCWFDLCHGLSSSA